jgi:hypothetical protein
MMTTDFHFCRYVRVEKLTARQCSHQRPVVWMLGIGGSKKDDGLRWSPPDPQMVKFGAFILLGLDV